MSEGPSISPAEFYQSEPSEPVVIEPAAVEPVADPAASPETAPKKEISPERQILEVTRVGTTLQSDVYHEIIGKTQEEKLKILNEDDPEGKMKTKALLAYNMRAGFITTRKDAKGNPVQVPVTAPEPIILHNHRDAQIKTISGIDPNDKKAYTCETAAGTVISVKFDELADAQLVTARDAILAGVSDAERPAVQMYLNSLTSEDAATVFEGKNHDKINAIIAEASNTRILITQKDTFTYVDTLAKLEESTLEVTDPKYAEKVAAVRAKADRRLGLVMGGDPSNLADAEGLTALILDTAEVDMDKVAIQLDALPGELSVASASVKDLEAQFAKLPHRDDPKRESEDERNAREHLEARLKSARDHHMELRIQKQLLLQTQELRDETKLRARLEAITTGKAPPDERAKLKALLNAENPEQALSKVMEIDKVTIANGILSQDKKNEAIAELEAQTEHRRAMYKKMGVGAGLLGLAMALMALSAFKTGGQ